VIQELDMTARQWIWTQQHPRQWKIGKCEDRLTALMLHKVEQAEWLRCRKKVYWVMKKESLGEPK